MENGHSAHALSRWKTTVRGSRTVYIAPCGTTCDTKDDVHRYLQLEAAAALARGHAKRMPEGEEDGEADGEEGSEADGEEGSEAEGEEDGVEDGEEDGEEGSEEEGEEGEEEGEAEEAEVEQSDGPEGGEEGVGAQHHAGGAVRHAATPYRDLVLAALDGGCRTRAEIVARVLR
eukprot:6324585-Prymnesium_polylepis.2